MGTKIRRSVDRKYFDHGWLKTYHTFSFASYYDPEFMGFRDLRVINEDRVDPGKGFPPHAHKDMEILSIVLEGNLAHRDSMGNESVIRANEVQAMSAGTGISHSEYNPSEKDPVHFLQIWIVPEVKGIAPRYIQESRLPDAPNQWKLLASKEGKEGSIQIQQDVELSSIALEAGKEVEKPLKPHRYGWLQVIDGELDLNGDRLHKGDGAAVDAGTLVKLKALSPSRVLFFDLK
jgi:redox-sensitive bicupin YhaK (pirin superfamily)